MATFLQLHMLTSYPPSNLNRDDLGRPKTAIMGGTNRLRISSQSLKRAWRKSEVFASHVAPAHIGTRTKEMGKQIFQNLCDKGIEETEAKEWAKAIAGVFGKLKSKPTERDPHILEIQQLAHFTPFEIECIDTLVKKLADTRQPPSDQDLSLLRKEHTAVDVALFGRMLASAPAFNTEAAAQVAHAVTVHTTAVELLSYTYILALGVVFFIFRKKPKERSRSGPMPVKIGSVRDRFSDCLGMGHTETRRVDGWFSF